MYVLKSRKEQQYKQDYIDVYGLHFTNDLATYAILTIRPFADYITLDEINKWLLDNNIAVSLLNNSTLGDVFYIANIAYINLFSDYFDTKEKCIEYATKILKSSLYEGQIFTHWLTDCDKMEFIINWEKYI